MGNESARQTSGVHLWLVLMKAYRSIERRASSSIEELGLCLSDFAILEILLHKGPLPVNTIGPRVPLTSGSATTAIDRLEKRGLVRREMNAGDRRRRVVHLTAEGRRMIEAAFIRHSDDIEAATAGLNERERATATRLLRKLGKSAEAGTEGSASLVKARHH
jgi:MarR family 2-MHQ and catechol resistance regulon transcriptional repressor